MYNNNNSFLLLPIILNGAKRRKACIKKHFQKSTISKYERTLSSKKSKIENKIWIKKFERLFRCLSKELKSEFWIVNWFYVMETHFALGWRELLLKCFAFLFEFSQLYSLNWVQSQFRTWDLESFKLYWYSTTKVNPDVGTALLRIPR